MPLGLLVDLPGDGMGAGALLPKDGLVPADLSRTWLVDGSQHLWLGGVPEFSWADAAPAENARNAALEIAMYFRFIRESPA
jgi:hypothetical protein